MIVSARIELYIPDLVSKNKNTFLSFERTPRWNPLKREERRQAGRLNSTILYIQRVPYYCFLFILNFHSPDSLNRFLKKRVRIMVVPSISRNSSSAFDICVIR